MHEHSIARALIGMVEKEARSRGASGVRRIRVRIGDLSGVEKDLLASAFAAIRQDTICAGADLAIESVRTSWACPACGAEVLPGEILLCPRCGVPARLKGGDEILLQTIDLEVG